MSQIFLRRVIIIFLIANQLVTTATAGGTVAGGACVVTTYGACAPVSPLVVGAGAGAGALAGGLLGNAIDWLESLALGQLTANNNANDNPPPASPTPPITTPASPPPDPNCPDGECNPQNVVSAQQLANQLRVQQASGQASTAFNADGTLSQEAIKGATEIMPANKLGNPVIPEGFAKYTTQSYPSPSGNFQVHFYMNPSTGEIYYGTDYKAVFNKIIGK